MRKFSCAVMSCLAFGLSATAAADEPLQTTPEPVGAFNYDAAPAVLYIPTEAVDLVPVAMCEIPQMNDDNPALGCTDLVLDPATFEPVANIDDIVTGVTDALAPYNVIVTTTRPPVYVPYQMLIPQDSEDPKSTSQSCTIAAADCDGIDRADIGFTSGGTANCMDPDPVMAALIAFGRMSGLEGKDNPMDVMGFPPDFAMPVTEFVDACDVIVTPEDPDTMMPTPLLCPSSQHEENGMCTMDDEQNSHQELLAVYGAADPAILTDSAAPEIGEVTGAPAQDAMLPAGTKLMLSVPVTDDSGYAMVRIAVESTALESEFGAPGGIVDKCFGGSCGVRVGGDATPQAIEFDPGMNMAYPDPSAPFSMNELGGGALPGGAYTITVEASDLAGNEATPFTVSFMVEGGGDETGTDPDTSGGDDNTDADDDDADDDDDDGDSSGDDDDDDSNATGDDGGDEGCSCTTGPTGGNAAFLLFGIAGLAMSRRRY